MLMFDLRRSILSLRMVVVVLMGLAILFLPAVYVKVNENRWMWQNDLIGCYQDATGFGVYLFCAPALASLCGSNLYARDQSNGFTSLALPRAGKARYIISKILCCGFSGGLSLMLPVALFVFAYMLIHLSALPCGEELRLIAEEALLFIPYGFSWAILGLGISCVLKLDYAAYASPYAIAMLLRLFASLSGIKWVSPNGLVSPLNTMLKPLWQNVAYQSTIILISIGLMITGINKWES